MNFTRRTYRVAIKRSERKARRLRSVRLTGSLHPIAESVSAYRAYKAQINHTRRLQQRKRRERK